MESLSHSSECWHYHVLQWVVNRGLVLPRWMKIEFLSRLQLDIPVKKPSLLIATSSYATTFHALLACDLFLCHHYPGVATFCALCSSFTPFSLLSTFYYQNWCKEGFGWCSSTAVAGQEWVTTGNPNPASVPPGDWLCMIMSAFCVPSQENLCILKLPSTLVMSDKWQESQVWNIDSAHICLGYIL